MLRPAEWLAMIATLFWSRELFILLTSLPDLFLGTRAVSDESYIALMLDLPWWAVTVLVGIIGGGVCLQALWLYPPSQRLSFLVGGTLACAVGYIFWYGFAGPLLLP